MTVQEWMDWGGDAQIVLFFAVLGVLIVLERLATFHVGDTSRRRLWTNYGLTAINIALLGALPVSLVGVAVLAQQHAWGILHELPVPVAVTFAATLLLRGFISWFTHWLHHKVPLLWRIHRVHHLDTQLDVSTTVRMHPLEFVSGLLIGLPLVLLVGLSPVALVVYELLDVVITLFSHTNICLPGRLNRALSLIIVTPNLHRVHHSSRQPDTDSNFSAVFPVWDIAFGTYRAKPAAELRELTLGLEAPRDTRTRNLVWLLTAPFRQLRATTSAPSEPSNAHAAQEPEPVDDRVRPVTISLKSVRELL